MVVGLLDTSVVIDLLRNHLPAHYWLLSQNSLGITSVVWLEVIQGAQDKVKQQRAIKLLKAFDQIDLTREDIQWAVDQTIVFSLSHNVGAFDCLIASTAYRLQVPLYTANLKHFTPLIGTLAQMPY